MAKTKKQLADEHNQKIDRILQRLLDYQHRVRESEIQRIAEERDVSREIMDARWKEGKMVDGKWEPAFISAAEAEGIALYMQEQYKKAEANNDPVGMAKAQEWFELRLHQAKEKLKEKNTKRGKGRPPGKIPKTRRLENALEQKRILQHIWPSLDAGRYDSKLAIEVIEKLFRDKGQPLQRNWAHG